MGKENRRGINKEEQADVWEIIKGLVSKGVEITFCQRDAGKTGEIDYFFYMKMTKWVGNIPYSYGMVWPITSPEGISIEKRIKYSVEKFLGMKPKDFKKGKFSRNESSDVITKITTPKSLKGD